VILQTPAMRLARPSDLSAIQRIVEAAYQPYIARIGSRPAPMDDDYAARVHRGEAHVIESAGRIVGLLVLVVESETMLLDNIAIDPAAQGTGLGRVLLDFAETTAIARGCTAIRLYTNAAMIENVEIYRRRGYQETHRGEELGFHRVYMRKALH